MSIDHTTTVPIDDVHVHYVPDWWYRELDGAARSVHPELGNLDAILAGTRDGGPARRVLSASIEMLYGAERPVERGALRRLNQALADAVSAHRESLLGLATVDPFGGPEAADDVRHAIGELGLHGIIVDAARGGSVIGESSTLPVLAAAAELGVPVFVHPIWNEDADRVRPVSGDKAASFGRGYRSGIALLSLLQAGALRSIPDLHVVFTALGVGSLYFAHERLEQLHETTGAPPHVYFDTTSLHVPSIRYALEVLGPERIVVGTDWPIRDDGRSEIVAAIAGLSLSDADQDRILHGNLRSIFTRNVDR